MTVLITGASGFIGSKLAETLAGHGMQLNLVVRREGSIVLPASKTFVLGDIHTSTDWLPALADIETVIHTAGIAHARSVTYEQYFRTNVEASSRLAQMAAAVGVKHFIFISSVGVHGRISSDGEITEASSYAPYNDYSLSKQQAEEALQEFCGRSAMALTIVRPPLVYAARAPGNFGRLLKMVASGTPLPIGSINNARAILALENLVDFLLVCVTQPEARDQAFLIADEQPVSTRQIVRWLAQGMGKSGWLVGLPPWMVYRTAKLLRQEERYQQLCGDLIVATDKARKLMGWQAPIKSEAGVIRAGAEFICRPNSPTGKI